MAGTKALVWSAALLLVTTSAASACSNDERSPDAASTSALTTTTTVPQPSSDVLTEALEATLSEHSASVILAGQGMSSWTFSSEVKHGDVEFESGDAKVDGSTSTILLDGGCSRIDGQLSVDIADQMAYLDIDGARVVRGYLDPAEPALEGISYVKMQRSSMFENDHGDMDPERWIETLVLVLGATEIAEVPSDFGPDDYGREYTAIVNAEVLDGASERISALFPGLAGQSSAGILTERFGIPDGTQLHVSVDNEGRLDKITYQMSDPSETSSLLFALADFGVTVDAAVPSAESVIDYADFLKLQQPAC